jgi:hypothetical protein
MASCSPDTGSVVFLRLSPDGERELLPVRLVELRSNVFTAQCDDGEIECAAGTKALVYFKHDGKFFRQEIRVDAVMSSESKTVIGFTAHGKPEAADARRAHRVSTQEASLVATFDGEEECPLLDVSLEGFAVISTIKHERGALLPVTLHYDGERFSGNACVQNVQRMGDGRFRHGLQSVGDRTNGGSLQRGQMQIGIGVQRAELERLTGAI